MRRIRNRQDNTTNRVTTGIIPAERVLSTIIKRCKEKDTSRQETKAG